MTFVAACRIAGNIVMFADTAVTSADPLHATHSSFGEAHVDGARRIQEGAMKLLQLSSGVVAGVAGDAEAGLQFLELVYRDLERRPASDLPHILEELTPAADASGCAFQLLVSYADVREARLYAMSHQGDLLLLSCPPRVVYSIGEGMPHAQRDQLAALVGMLDGHVPAELAEMACLALIQTFGAYDPLIARGVGGAVFSAIATAGATRWQAPVSYVFLGPVETSQARLVDATDEVDPAKLAQRVGPVDLGFARTFVQDECGVVVTTLAEPALRVFVPSTLASPEERVEQLVATHQKPYRAIRDGDYVAFVSRAYRKIVLLDPGVVATQAHVIKMGHVGGHTWFALGADLMKELSTPPSVNGTEVVVAYVDAGCVRAFHCPVAFAQQ